MGVLLLGPGVIHGNRNEFRDQPTLDQIPAAAKRSPGWRSIQHAGISSTLRTPLTSNNYVGRIDHDFNANHRFFASFRAFKLLNVTTNQVDVGGLLGGGGVGQYVAKARAHSWRAPGHRADQHTE